MVDTSDITVNDYINNMKIISSKINTKFKIINN